MVYSTVPKMGLTIFVKPYRKSSGTKGCGRGGSTGKKADITQVGKDPITLYGDSFKDLCKKIRAQFKVPTSVNINQTGVTHV